MSNRPIDETGFYCTDAFCDGDHTTPGESCEDEPEGMDDNYFPDDAGMADYYGDGVYDQEIAYLNR